MIRLKFTVLAIAFFVVSVFAVRAQDIGVDWSTKTLTSYPAKVRQTMTVRVRLTNANELLYDYKIDLVAVPQSQNDWDSIASLVLKASGAPGAAPPAPDPCQAALTNAKNALSDVNGELQKKNTPINPDNGSGGISSVPRQKTVDYWNSTIKPKDTAVRTAEANLKTAMSSGTCAAASMSAASEFVEQSFGPYQIFADDFASRLGNSGEIDVTVTLSPENDYKLTITESYNKGGKTTVSGTQTFTFSPQSDILTLSAGTLLTQIQSRTYTSGSLPGQSGNVLVVSGQSPIRPILVAQLNYAIPKLSTDSLGLAISTGAALQFTGGNSGVSNVGFVGGLSFHLWHRFYVTPGVHVGEFADFPAGFTGPNQSIPSGFGQLAPVKRWTVRFALGLTYKAVDFTKFTPSSKPTKSGGS